MPRATKCTVYLLVDVKHHGAIAVSVQSSQPTAKSSNLRRCSIEFDFRSGDSSCKFNDVFRTRNLNCQPFFF